MSEEPGRAVSEAPATAFGRFRLLPERQLLLDRGQAVQIGGRALDILLALTERAGEVVSKDELVARAWPNVTVDESNLRTQMAQLRRVLGDGEDGQRYIATVAGRGYRFVAPLLRADRDEPSAEEVEVQHKANVPFAPRLLVRPVGRDRVVEAIAGRLKRSRLVTVTGAGGIGKTTVALALAARARGYEDGTWFVDLGSVTRPELVVEAVADGVGLTPPEGREPSQLAVKLQMKRALLILDCCEHLAEAVAILAEGLLRDTSELRILATSREPLRAHGEIVHRLESLATPSRGLDLSATEALSFSAVDLFAERANAAAGFVLTDADAPFIAEVCRKLDGNPLAIEIVASGMAALTARELAFQLTHRLRLDMHGRRTAVPRHRTLNAMLDWSYDLLTLAERSLLERLSVFSGQFDLEAAAAVGGHPTNTLETLTALVSKSLVVADLGAATPYYRLLDTTRTYASEKLASAGQSVAARRLHAGYLLSRFESAAYDVELRVLPQTARALVGEVDNVRVALDWLFAAPEERNLGVALAAAALPLWPYLALYDEGRRRLELALAYANSSGPRNEMLLQAALGSTLTFIPGATAQSDAAWSRALVLAEELDDSDYQLRALWGLWLSSYNRGDYRRSVLFGERFRAIANDSDDVQAAQNGTRILSLSLFFLGDHTGARQLLEQMLSGPILPEDRGGMLRFRFDARTAARSLLALILWAQGLADHAQSEIARCVDEARELNHPLSLALALERACHLALLVGDFDLAEIRNDELRGVATDHGLGLWFGWADVFDGVLLSEQGEPAEGVDLMRHALGRFPKDEFRLRYVSARVRFAMALARGGQFAEAIATIDDLLPEDRGGEEPWHVTELLCVKAEILRLCGRRDEAILAANGAVERARQQKGLAWELRAMLCIARAAAGKENEAALRSLAEVYERFTEGFGTADLVAARSLLKL